MIKGNKKLFFLGGLFSVLITGGVLGFFIFDIQETQALNDQGGLECFLDGDCSVPYDYCTYGYGLATCSSDIECNNCGSSVQGSSYRCYNSSFCQVQLPGWDSWANCGTCYDEADPPPPPDDCDVTANNFDKSFYITDSSGVTRFAITDGGHLLGLNGGIWDNVNLSDYYDPGAEDFDYFPVYNGATLIALFEVDTLYAGALDGVLIAGSVYNFQVNLSPPEPGSFVIKNSADMVVAYINPDGDLYLMGCVDYNGYSF